MRWPAPVGARLWIRLALATLLLLSVATPARIPVAPAMAEPMEVEQLDLMEIPPEEPLPEPAMEGPTLQPALDSVEYRSALSEFPAEMDNAQEETPVGEADFEGDVIDAVRSSVTSRGGTRPASAVQPEPSLGDRMAAVARQYEGFRYSWGGTSPRTGFDCSGFMWYVYQEAGNPLPSRNLWGMRSAGPSISQDELLPGDLLFFENTYTYGLSHGGVYLGDNLFIHAVSEELGVKIDPLRGSGWEDHYAGASRPWQR